MSMVMQPACTSYSYSVLGSHAMLQVGLAIVSLLHNFQMQLLLAISG